MMFRRKLRAQYKFKLLIFRQAYHENKSECQKDLAMQCRLQSAAVAPKVNESLGCADFSESRVSSDENTEST
jgi:hypothetical protein